MTRTGFVGGMFAVVALAVGSAWVGVAGLPSAVSPAAAQDAEPRELSAFEQQLLEPGPLAEMSLGDPDAPITIIEYASLTCGHCASF
ncbi:MAG TPA: thioredoxin domain-containing protein, partial [Methylomirabilota bacterium]|nr:thioredoxin domain-containing protein [Methylomirabilota bacterium]